MFKKSFAKMLKENLREDSFKSLSRCKEVSSHLSLLPVLAVPFLLEIKRYYLTVKDVEQIYSSRDFHKRLFKEPVKLVFYWCEDDWQGSLFVVYTYKNKYIYIDSGFGSCDLCDEFPLSEDSLMRKFKSLNISDSIQNISLPTYSHPELLKHFDKFKLKVSKQYQNTTQYQQKYNLKVISQEDKAETGIKIDLVDTPTTQRDTQTQTQKQNFTTWASLFK